MSWLLYFETPNWTQFALSLSHEDYDLVFITNHADFLWPGSSVYIENLEWRVFQFGKSSVFCSTTSNSHALETAKSGVLIWCDHFD
jgi:hypothetical protein